MEMLDKIFLAAMPTIAIALIAGFIYGGIRSSKIDNTCAEKHHHQPFIIEETDFGTTKYGCRVSRILTQNSECNGQAYVYVTNCRSVCWDVPSGKTTRRECNS